METETTTITVLRLDEKEREWLKGVMQNPIGATYYKEVIKGDT